MTSTARENRPDERSNGATKALIVDDNDIDLRAAARLLRGPFNTVRAQSAEVAIQLLDADVGLVLSDYRMDGADGLWLLTVVQRRIPHARRLLMSAAPDDRCRKALREGIVNHLVDKPLRPGQLSTFLGCLATSAQNVQDAPSDAGRH